MITNIRRFVGFAVITGLLLAPASSFALEPANNQAPWVVNNGTGKVDTTVYYYTSIGGITWQFAENISSSSDVDYVFFVCTTGLVREVSINFTNSTGDLDVEAYDLNGRLLGTSAGVSNTELVNVGSFGLRGVVLRVFGYRGATGTYSPGLQCSG